MNVNFSDDHLNPQDSQLIVAITGSPEYIKNELNRLLEDITIYNKPLQGGRVQYGGVVHVLTPIWNKEEY